MIYCPHCGVKQQPHATDNKKAYIICKACGVKTVVRVH